ncbi:unnamed protein product [Aureobasidium mustum]|uniref:Uncharacterized protein n=1 Tax=Aureobasidium mustum TaxID=2773714 RepID=A0A9N8K856_9PEZI|nr:unnamed protein product [Aureobasidium mustum]
MSFLLHSRPLGIGLGLGAAFTSYSLLTPRRNIYALCDASPSNAFNSYTHNAKVPVVTRRGGLNPNAVRQISSGSIAGMSSPTSETARYSYKSVGVLGGMAVSLFSKPLTLLIGLLIVGIQVNTPLPFCLSLLSHLFLTLLSQLLILTSKQFAESQLGISLIPYGRMQRYFTSIDLRSAMQDNVAFKLAFGATFALTGFAQL